jgi:hypothetical protein
LSRKLLLGALSAFALANAILYAGLLPLWDGFDEPFHYGYVEQLWRRHSLPVLHDATLTQEIWDSFPLAPASYLVKRNVPAVIEFGEYFSLPPAARVDLRRRLEALDPRTAAVPAGGLNYEAQQSPLAYALLAPFDAVLSGMTLIHRILLLRLLCGLSAAIATGLLAWRLGAEFDLPDRWRFTALYVVFSTQMFYATTAHVANDFLSAPLYTALLLMAVVYYRKPTASAAVLLVAVLSAGLLAKAYFLAGVPFVAGVLLLRRKLDWRAGLALLPAAAWYARNVALYHDVSGIQQTDGGVPIRDLLRAAASMPWLQSLEKTVSLTLWMGNNSDTAFSAKTLHWLMLLLGAAAVAYVATARRRWQPAERVTLAGLTAYAAALGYSAVLHFWTTHAGMISPAGWYTQAIFPAAICLLMLGLSRAGRAGEAVRVLMLWSWTYFLCVVYLAKLIPMYGGYPDDRVRIAALWRWYTGSFAAISETLSTLCLLPGACIWALSGMVVLLAVVLAVALIRSTYDRAASRIPPPA